MHSDRILVQLFINNEFVNSVSGKTIAVLNPSTGEKIADVQEADKVRMWGVCLKEKFEANLTIPERAFSLFRCACQRLIPSRFSPYLMPFRQADVDKAVAAARAAFALGSEW